MSNTKIITLQFFFLLSLFFSSCNKIMPSGFWAEFEKNLIRNHISDQGPWGGHKAMHWKTEQKNYFGSKKIIEFAAENGWVLVDSINFLQISVNDWVQSDNPIFPLSYTGFNANFKKYNGTYENFPRWIENDCVVYVFKTNWLAIAPGTDNANDENGVVVVNKSKTELSVYHLWGE